ncbi:MAG TPA: sugar phosphate nucleotidyltransferase [Chthoniobacteraceae bacterium]|nr:sugar phosphate nucleotidyltransferase [Chthoniobacteraceae bacterium]
MITSAFVLGAGLGTRLKSLTKECPKPLVPVANKPLITYAFDHLLGAGVDRFIVNTHWRADAYAAAFPDATYRGFPIEFRREAPEILETAGGIKNVEDLLLGETFIVYNGDILTDLPLSAAMNAHFAAQNEVTMVLRSKDGPLQVAFDQATQRIADISNRIDPHSRSAFLFTGIYLIDPAFFQRIPPKTKISVIPIFLEMIRTGARLGGIVIDEGHWWDLGTREQYLAVHAFLGGDRPNTVWIDHSARVARDAKLSGVTAIGARAVIGARASLRDCIVWEGARIEEGSALDQCIVTAHAQISGRHTREDL